MIKSRIVVSVARATFCLALSSCIVDAASAQSDSQAGQHKPFANSQSRITASVFDACCSTELGEHSDLSSTCHHESEPLSPILCTSARSDDSKKFAGLERWLQLRSASAKRLIEDGSVLKSGVIRITDSTKLLLADSTLPQGVSSSKAPSYTQLLNQYHDALAAYMAHRKAVQEHASQFHQQAKMQEALNAPISVPNLKPLAVKAQDQCAALQLQEKQLLQMESKLSQMIQFLITQKGQMPAAAYQNALGEAESAAMQDRSAAVAFESGVFAKQNSTRQELHDKIHLAEDSGDFVQSQQVYTEATRRENIVQQETERAQMHMGLAQTFIGKLQMLGSQMQGGGSASGSSESFANADAELDSEYQRVQQLYALLQAAGGKP